jgi:hypothetical protein
MRKVFVGLLLFVFFAPLAEAQFGRNKVGWDEEVKYIPTSHFSIFHWMDLEDPNQRYHLEQMANQLEGSYDYLSGKLQHTLSEKIPVIVYKTHRQFESNHIDETGGFLPESVGAFAESERNRVVMKLDFLPPLNKTIVTHELEHIFYFDMAKMGFLGRVFRGHPSFFTEGVRADFFANLYSPYTRDDIRRMVQRGIASDPNMYLPTWDMMMAGRCSFPRVCNPYIVGSMVAEFIHDEYGEDAILKFVIDGTSEGGGELMKALTGATDGALNKSNFDQAHRDYWSSRFQRDMLDKQRPYQDTDNYTGRSITPEENPYYMLSPVLSPLGDEISCFTIGNKGITIVSFPIRDKSAVEVEEDKDKDKDNGYKVLYDKLPPRPYEYLISQGLVTWPFNGFDLDWDENENLLAFFARKNDHVLVLMDADTGKIVREVELPLDQAFSPSFSPSGKVVYFSASKNVTRDIYAYDLERDVLFNVTDDLSFDTAPAISPDGTRLVYVSFVGDFQKLFMIDLTTKRKIQLTFNRYNDSSPSWSDDGEYIVYTSDEPKVTEGDDGLKHGDRVWNLYTMYVQTREINQWTDFFGGVFTSRFAKNRNDKIYYVAYWQYDQIQNMIVPNFRIYEAELKDPIRTFVSRDNKEPIYWAYRKSDLFNFGFDENQVINAQEAPKNWSIRPRLTYAAYNTYWGNLINSGVDIESILGDERHSVLFTYSSFFRYMDYSYFNQRKRYQWGGFIREARYPLGYTFYDIVKQNPDQPVLTSTFLDEFNIGVVGAYPFDKFTRVEIGFKIRNRDYDLSLPSNTRLSLAGDDASFFDFFSRSNRHSNIISTAFVRDTRLYSSLVQGPWHGNALRVEFEAAPPSIGNSANYSSLRVDARKYISLTAGTLFAMRATATWNTDANGDFILMGGNDTLRGYPYGSIVGNRAGYVSAELRFPLIDGIVFPKGIGVGPFRGLAFVDAGTAGFSSDDLPNQDGFSYGMGLQFNFMLPMNLVWTKTDWHEYDKWRSDFYIAYNW